MPTWLSFVKPSRSLFFRQMAHSTLPKSVPDCKMGKIAIRSSALRCSSENRVHQNGSPGGSYCAEQGLRRMKIATEIITAITMRSSVQPVQTVFTTVLQSAIQAPKNQRCMLILPYSVTGYDESHQQFTFNALYEKGTMTQEGTQQSGFGEQDHIVPQVFFPSVITIKDVTVNSFAYVLNNVLRTKRYGAQTTRTGRIFNHIVGVVFADGEIFSNLKIHASHL